MGEAEEGEEEKMGLETGREVKGGEMRDLLRETKGNLETDGTIGARRSEKRSERREGERGKAGGGRRLCLLTCKQHWLPIRRRRRREKQISSRSLKEQESREEQNRGLQEQDEKPLDQQENEQAQPPAGEPVQENPGGIGLQEEAISSREGDDGERQEGACQENMEATSEAKQGETNWDEGSPCQNTGEQAEQNSLQDDSMGQEELRQGDNDGQKNYNEPNHRREEMDDESMARQESVTIMEEESMMGGGTREEESMITSRQEAEQVDNEEPAWQQAEEASV